MNKQVTFHKSSIGFFTAIKPQMKKRVSSFSDDSEAIGKLRLPGVANGRYESRHPILDASGNQVGSLIKGVQILGYTYACIYSDRAGCFFIAHCPFSAVWSTPPGHDSYVSIVEATGHFAFSGKGTKFEPIKSLKLPKGFVNDPEIFTLMNDGRNILYVTKKGISFLDVFQRDILSATGFDELSYSTVGFAVSPKVNILAVAFSHHNTDDPLTGDPRYRNFVRLYQLDRGAIIGEQELVGNQYVNWQPTFGNDGRSLKLECKDSQHVFELKA